MSLTLRSLQLSDADDVMEWLSDERAARFCTWDPNVKKSDAIWYIKEIVRPHPWFRAICVNGRAAGAISVTKNEESSPGVCRGELGYVLGSKYWGKGYGTAAVNLAMKRVFIDRPELVRVEALVDVDNHASLRVMEKAGFHREGVLRQYAVVKGRYRDFVIFSFLSTDLQPNARSTRSYSSDHRSNAEIIAALPDQLF